MLSWYVPLFSLSPTASPMSFLLTFFPHLSISNGRYWVMSEAENALMYPGGELCADLPSRKTPKSHYPKCTTINQCLRTCTACSSYGCYANTASGRSSAPSRPRPPNPPPLPMPPPHPVPMGARAHGQRAQSTNSILLVSERCCTRRY